jgi:hypothetical protein
MFWTLLFAHFYADYPLQTDWMAEVKRTWNGLILHVGMHLITMLVVTWGAWREVWGYLLALAAVHYAIDTLKNLLNHRRPGWVVGPYFLDQFLHLLSITWISGWTARRLPALALPLPDALSIYLLALLWVTHVWFITERIIYHGDEAYVTEVNAHHKLRMLTRFGVCAALTLGWRALPAGAAVSAAPARTPYRGRFRRRAMLVDAAVGVGVAAFLILMV